jgi:hypothetical protein
MLLTTRDEFVPLGKQWALAQVTSITVVEVPLKHLEIGWLPEEYHPPLLEALVAVSEPRAVQAA